MSFASIRVVICRVGVYSTLESDGFIRLARGCVCGFLEQPRNWWGLGPNIHKMLGFQVLIPGRTVARMRVSATGKLVAVRPCFEVLQAAQPSPV